MKTSFTRALKLSAFLAAASLPAVALLPGCGGGGGDNGPSVVQNAGGPVNLGNGQTGSLGFARFSNGTAFGSFTISDGTGPITGTPFPTGTNRVSGNVNGNEISLLGAFPGSSLIRITVTLPTGNTAGSYTVTLNGQTFTGSVVNSTATPAPTVTTTGTPVATATTTGTPVATATTTGTPLPTNTPSPTNTPFPTNTPVPTNTPLPTSTPVTPV